VLHPHFLQLAQNCRRLLACSAGPFQSKHLQEIGFDVIRDANDIGDAIVSNKLFTDEFCKQLTSELVHFAKSGIEHTRPNTMNRNGGVLLYELGFQSFLDKLVEDYLNPVAKFAVPNDFEGYHLDSHKVFTVAYQHTNGDEILHSHQTTLRSGGPIDKHLSLHNDNAEATFNVHLGGEWTGGGLFFYGKGASGVYERDLKDVKHPTRVVKFCPSSHQSRSLTLLHSGSEFHEACPISSGWRLNLIMWLRSSGVRNQKCPMCGRPPILVQVGSLAGEGFTVSQPVKNIHSSL
jgi:hypothetical protein